MIQYADHEVLLEPELQTRPRKTQQYILIVDDERDQSEVLADCLERQGFNTATSASAESAVSRIAERIPDLILMDIELPDANGLTLCQQLVDATATCMIPIIVMSGEGRNDVIRRARRAGCRYYVRKPYDPSALLLLVRSALEEVA